MAWGGQAGMTPLQLLQVRKWMEGGGVDVYMYDAAKRRRRRRSVGIEQLL